MSFSNKIAERAVQLGGIARARCARPPPAPGSKNILPRSADGSATLKPWRRRFHFGREARVSIEEANALDDADTLDLFTEVSRGIGKWLWFVEAHSQASQ